MRYPIVASVTSIEGTSSSIRPLARLRPRFTRSAMLCIAFLSAFSPDVARAEFVRGDANGDMMVDISDPVQVLNYLFVGGSLDCLDSADANDDSTVDISDSVATLNYLFVGGPEFPPPFPNCGPDPTADTLDCTSPPAGCTPVTPAPQIFSTPLALAYVDTPYMYLVEADGSGESVTYSLEAGPVGALIDPVNGLLDWTPTSIDVGPHAFLVRSTSSVGFDEQGFTVTVSGWPDAPVIETPASTTIGLAVTLTGSAVGANTVEFINEDQVVVASVSAPRFEFAQSIALIPNSRNLIHVRAINAQGLVSAPTTLTVIQDSQPPELFVDNPVDGGTTFDAEVDLAGRVSDMLSGFMGMIVTFNVNGGPLQIAAVTEGIGTNGTFFAGGVDLAMGPNTIEVNAQDAVGNGVTIQVVIEREALDPAAPTLTRISGNGQSAEVNSDLDLPIVVEVTDAGGSPFANKLVNFQVTRSDGQLRSPGADLAQGSMLYQVFTDDFGQASAMWRLGSDAGDGNQRVEVTSAGIQNPLLFCASADPGAPAQMNVGAGNNQRGEVGMPAECVLCAWVSDGCNGIGGIPVTFTVTRGNGTVQGASEITVISDPTGHAEVFFVYGEGPGNNIITANTTTNMGAPAVFNLFGVARDPSAATSFSGLVLSNSSQPLTNATCTLEIPGQAPRVTTTANDGSFEFPDIVGEGPSELTIDGGTTNEVGSQPVPANSFPSLHFEPIIVPNAENQLPMAILLPQLNPANWRNYSTSTSTVLTVEDVAGLRMVVAPGSMTLESGLPAPEGTPISLNIVHHDNIPMPMPDGAAPPFAWTLQPAGATFDPPITVDYPNMSGLPAGAIANFLTFSHDTGKFEIFASGSVSSDGTMISTDPDDGLTLAGWGGNCPPYTVTSSVAGPCDFTPNGCGTPEGLGRFVPDVYPIVGSTCFGIVVFTPACNMHDECWSSCAADQASCDWAFFLDLTAICAAEFGSPLELNCFATCEVIAFIYYVAVVASSRYFDEVQAAVEGCGLCPVALMMEAAAAGPPGTPTAPYVDTDGDLLPDEWENRVGLSPSDPFDSAEDSDMDGLVNLQEFIFGCDPFDDDSDGDGTGDFEQAMALQPAKPDQLDSTWTVMAGDSVVAPLDGGTFVIPNISLPDQFGPTGPGSPPDFVSDDFIRITATSTSGGTPRYAFSEPFRVSSLEPNSVDALTFTSIPPPLPSSLRFATPGILVGEVGEGLPLSVIATLADGSDLDVTPIRSWTTYRTSNPDRFTVDEEGVFVGSAPGTAFVTALNEGAIAVRRVDIVASATVTTVTGYLNLADGTPVSGAEVTTGFGGMALSELDGGFVFDVTLPGGATSLVVTTTADIGGTIFVGSAVATVVPDGFSDAGIVELTAAGEGLLFPGHVVELGAAPTFVTSGDVDQDGNLDFLAIDGNSLHVLLGMGGGRFAPAVEYSTSLGTTHVELGDLDGDGNLDAVVSTFNAGTIGVLLGNGDGTFQPTVEFPAGDFPFRVAIGDLDSDGNLDVITSNYANGTLSALLGNGDGTLGPPMTFATAIGPYSIGSGDFNADGALDVVVTHLLSNTLGVLLGNGDGTFAPVVEYTVDTAPNTIAVGDIDADGDLDFATTSQGGLNELNILLGNGDGTFVSTTSYAGSLGREVVMRDLDNDGDLDLGVTRLTGEVAVYLGNGDGTFLLSQSYPAGSDTVSLILEDVDGDFDFDLTTAQSSGGSITILTGRGDGTFNTSQSFVAGIAPFYASVGDVNGDGNADVVTANIAGGTVSVLLGAGDGTLLAPIDTSPVPGPSSVTLGDLDGDTNLDLVTTNFFNGTGTVFLGLGDGTFALSAEYTLGSNPAVGRLGDLDSDGDLDFVSTNGLEDDISVLLGNGDGTFMPAVTFPCGNGPFGLTLCDLNADGALDVVTADTIAGGLNDTVSILLGAGDGTFATPTAVSVGNEPNSVAHGDLNDDGNLDLVTANFASDDVSILLGNGDGTFQPAVDIPVGEAPVIVELMDFDADGDLDLVASNSADNTISLLLADGTGGFEPALSFGTGVFPTSVVSADLDGDGDPDLITTNRQTNNVSVLPNLRIP